MGSKNKKSRLIGAATAGEGEEEEEDRMGGSPWL